MSDVKRLPAMLRFFLAVLLLVVLNWQCRQATGAKGTPAVKAAGKAKQTRSKDGTVTLFGEIDELSYICSSAGVKLSGGKLPARVEKVSLGSAAAYSGVREGDAVTDVIEGDNHVVITVERKGKKYQATIATDVTGLKKEFEAQKIPMSFGDSAFDKELKLLKHFNVLVFLDRSQSMDDRHAGVPGDLSKWMWCKQQLDNLYLATDRVLERGFDLVLFNNTFQERKDVTLWDIKQVFGSIRPEGARKNIAAPLESTLSTYFRYKKKDAKPLIIAVLTDGKENSGRPLQEVIMEAADKVSRPDEVNVIFMQVGDSIMAEELLEDLDRNLLAKGAKYDIVTYKNFTELRNRGLVYQLLAIAEKASKSLPKTPPVEAGTTTK